MLKITVPFREKKEVIPLIEAGAQELYCSYLSPEWEKKYTSLEFERKGEGSNFTDLKQLSQALDLAHGRGVRVFFALNGLYVKEQYPLLLKIIRQLNKLDLDGYIVADLGVLLTLKKQGCKKEIHISTGGTVFNSQAASFYKGLGASRIVLDRQMSLDSIRAIALDNPGIDFEVFILNTLCVYIDGFCTFLHSYGRDPAGDISQRRWRLGEKVRILSTYDYLAMTDACCLKYSILTYDDRLRKKVGRSRIRPTFYKQLNDGIECGACAIYDINKTRVKSLKIVGRQLTPEKRLKDTKFIRSALDIINNNRSLTREAFICRVQELYSKTYEYNKKCRGNNCYHPEVLTFARSNF